MRIESFDRKRILIFLAIAFGIAWATALVIYLTGGLSNSPIVVPALKMNLAYLLMATSYMFAPALAHILTRLVTREGWQGLWLKPRFKKASRFWMIAWFLPGLLTVLGAAAFFYLFPGSFDANLTNFRAQLQAASDIYGTEESLSINPWLILIIQLFQALILAPILNAIPTFGEEFGWRAYLLPKLMPIGSKKAVLISGVIWGVWHWPVILMGYNYGFDYPGTPWLGLLGMIWVTVGLAVIFSWLTLRSGSVWPAVIAHGAVNGIAAIGALVVLGETNPLLGPTPVGIVGGLFFAILAINLLFHPIALKPSQLLELTELESDLP